MKHGVPAELVAVPRRTESPDPISDHAFSVDVEEWFQVGAFEHTLERGDWPTFESRVVYQTDKTLDLLAAHGVKASFFCLGWVAERHPALIRRIADAGHEIGCHGMDHRRIFTMSDAEFAADIARAKGLLEDSGGVAVAGYRAPSFSLTPEVWHFYRLLAEAGFTYSSSIVPARTDHYGAAGAPRAPFRPLPDSAIIEAPLAVAQVGPLTVPASGGGYFRLLPASLSRWLMRRAQRQTGQGTIFYMHPWELDPDQPRVAEAPLKSRFRHYTGLAAMQGKLGALLDDWQFQPLRAYLNRHYSVEV